MTHRKDNVVLNVEKIKNNANGGEYKFTISIPQNVGWIDSMNIVIDSLGYPFDYKMKHISNDNGYATFTINLDLHTCPLYRYYFKYVVNGQTYYVNYKDTKDHIEYDEKNKLSVNFDTPEWSKGAIMCHIFVDRFKRGSKFSMQPMERRQIHQSWDEDVVLGDNPNVKHYYENEEVWNVDFFGGDLQGIEQSLDYLESFGVTILYLSPVVRSQSTHRYDAAKYDEVDPYAGSNEDLKNLCTAAHKKGMKVILDIVPNHVGDESIYFDRYGEYKTGDKHEDGAFNNPESKYHDMFRYKYDNGFEENTFWWNISTMPENNSSSKVWREVICGKEGALATYYSLGIDGVRIDVPENVDDQGIIDINRTCILYNPDSLILGELWELATRKDRPFIGPDRLHSVMNYPLMDGLVRYLKYKDPTKLAYTIRDIRAEYPEATIDSLMNFTSTHDISRLMTLLGKKRFDTYGKFESFSNDLKIAIFESLRESGFSDTDIYYMINGDKEISYEKYHELMWKLGEKGVPTETINYLKTVLSFSPFKPFGTQAKDLEEDIEKDLVYTKNYHLTEQEYLEARDLVQLYTLFTYSWRGMPTFFYGDEVGMQGLNNLANRRPHPWDKGDPVLREWFRLLGRYHNSNPFLKTAAGEMLELNKDICSFTRESPDEKAFIAFNNSKQEQSIYIPPAYRDGEKILTLKKSNKEVLYPHGGIVIKK